jgi:hypothetical protein
LNLELTQILESGESLYGYEAEKLGLIDQAISPEDYFTTHFKTKEVEIKGVEVDWK